MHSAVNLQSTKQTSTHSAVQWSADPHRKWKQVNDYFSSFRLCDGRSPERPQSCSLHSFPKASNLSSIKPHWFGIILDHSSIFIVIITNSIFNLLNQKVPDCKILISFSCNWDRCRCGWFHWISLLSCALFFCTGFMCRLTYVLLTVVLVVL